MYVNSMTSMVHFAEMSGGRIKGRGREWEWSFKWLHYEGSTLASVVVSSLLHRTGQYSHIKFNIHPQVRCQD